MANRIPLAIADVELQLATAISIGSTSFTLNSANDDDGNALPAGLYCFTVDSGTSNKEYLIGQLNGVNVTSVKTVSRQGAETSGAARAHRIGAPAIVTNFATLQRVADALRGAVELDGASPLTYDAEPTLSDNKELATVGYVLSVVTGGTISFDKQTIAGTGGENISAGDLVYFNTTDREWYKCDADTLATVDGVLRGIALGSGSNGVAITGGVQLSGAYTSSSLTAGALYYASNTAGAIATSAGTVKHVVGVALSTTVLWIIPQTPETIPTRTKDALAGGGDYGTPSTANKFITQSYNSSPTGLPTVQTFTSSGTWTKPAGLKYVIVEGVGGGAGGGAGYGVGSSPDDYGGGGGGGGYFRKIIAAASLGATETVTIGAGGSGGTTSGGDGVDGGNTTFGSHATGNGGIKGLGGNASPRPGLGGLGGTATGGNVNVSGGSGGRGGNDTNIDNGGKGGDSFFGRGGIETTSPNVGNNGTGYGSGGSGGTPDGSSYTSGGNGSGGFVLVTEYYS